MHIHIAEQEAGALPIGETRRTLGRYTARRAGSVRDWDRPHESWNRSASSRFCRIIYVEPHGQATAARRDTCGIVMLLGRSVPARGATERAERGRASSAGCQHLCLGRVVPRVRPRLCVQGRTWPTKQVRYDPVTCVIVLGDECGEGGKAAPPVVVGIGRLGG